MKKLISSVLLTILATMLCLSVAAPATHAQELIEPSFDTVYEGWLDESQDTENEVFDLNQGDSKTSSLIPKKESFGYDQDVMHVRQDDEITFKLDIKHAGMYQMSMDFYSLNDGLIDSEFSIKINDKFQHYESRRIVAPTSWNDKDEKFSKNEYGNELIPEQAVIRKWNTIELEDANHLVGEGLRFLLEEGVNEITLTASAGSMYLGNLSLYSPKKIKTYDEYKKKYKDNTVSDSLEIYEAEHPSEKNNSYIRAVSRKDVNVVPYNERTTEMNALGDESWRTSGQSVTWTINAPQEGLYNITFKTQQLTKQNAPVFREIRIDGVIPFDEMSHYRFEPNPKWHNQTLENYDSEAYNFFLEAGKHTLTLTADASPMSPIINKTKTMMNEINDLGLSIKKLTGNQKDTARDWEIEEYIPEIGELFDEWENDIAKVQEMLQKTYGKNNTNSQEALTLNLIETKIKSLKKDPNKLPTKLNELSEGSSSITQLIGDLQASFENQSLVVDRFYVHGTETELPDAVKGFATRLISKTKEFFYSFVNKEGNKSKNKEVIDVWVARSQQYVDLMQNMADSSFVSESGKQVQFSVMPNEQKLILANSGGKQPDVALGISVGTPYELAIRGAAMDLSQFDDFVDETRHFSAGAFMPMMIDDKVYALPETQDFYVMYYRKDIMDNLDLDIPDTWADVKALLPELQRYGMNFFIPLSGATGSKPFMFTAPFIYQSGGDLYSEDGLSSNINSDASIEGLKEMTELYTLYGLPLQVGNFYNEFRYGSLPIGISNFETYVKLKSAAPEIANSWELALYPSKDGERWATGSAQSAMIFEDTLHKEESWEFLKWWMSTEIQNNFAKNLQISFGPEYMWNTANLEAFDQIPIKREHKEVVLEQWEWLKEVPKTPGAYILEREISNTWSDVIFDGMDLRESVDRRTIVIDREIRRKLEEFGYIKNGKKIQDYKIPQLETIEEWRENDE